jgi:hypothetical protein
VPARHEGPAPDETVAAARDATLRAIAENEEKLDRALRFPAGRAETAPVWEEELLDDSAPVVIAFVVLALSAFALGALLVAALWMLT